MEQIERASEVFLNKIDMATEDDALALKNGRPATNKIKLIGEVVETMSKVQYQTYLLERGVLKKLRRWLDPLPDGALPNYNIREGILSVLPKLPIEVSHLRESGIGKAVMLLSKSPYESQQTKKLLFLWFRTGVVNSLA
eukprot:TRINITY_DN3935_c0_g1_i1.p1 TRINITY_DN3935_c0_g1~~TRINITY_DN3935_c0_g1_i1.p1  ORF type:complete len:139 (+),score=37.64 TRINITY_DN3935_c0_g1_i1:200-616(+)